MVCCIFKNGWLYVYKWLDGCLEMFGCMFINGWMHGYKWLVGCS